MCFFSSRIFFGLSLCFFGLRSGRLFSVQLFIFHVLFSLPFLARSDQRYASEFSFTFTFLAGWANFSDVNVTSAASQYSRKYQLDMPSIEVLVRASSE